MERLQLVAVVIGVAMVSGTYVLTDTFQKAFDDIFTESYAGTDAIAGDHERPPARDQDPRLRARLRLRPRARLALSGPPGYPYGVRVRVIPRRSDHAAATTCR